MEVTRLLNNKKLLLILDLDHTLLNSVRISDVPSDQSALLQRILEREEPLGQKRLLHCLRDKNLWTKLRPGVHAMLEALRSRYDMHIYTMGDRSYAGAVRKLLDPDGRYFTEAISACDSTSTSAKDLDVALIDHKLVVILDDTTGVWPNHLRNLIQVERYHFFPHSLRSFQQSGANSFLTTARDESASDGMLATCTAVLKDVHARFFSPGNVVPIDQRDVRYHLATRKQDILKGCVVTFSRCWPQAHPAPYNHDIYKLAESLGADCRLEYNSNDITHVVAASPGTAKANVAQSEGKYVVLPQWLHACMFRWRRMPEENYVPGEAKLPNAYSHVEQAAQALAQEGAAGQPAAGVQANGGAEAAGAQGAAAGQGAQEGGPVAKAEEGAAAATGATEGAAAAAAEGDGAQDGAATAAGAQGGAAGIQEGAAAAAAGGAGEDEDGADDVWGDADELELALAAAGGKG